MLPKAYYPQQVGATLLLPFPFLIPRTTETGYGGGDGSSYENAVIVRAPDGMAGVRAEHVYVAQHFPGARPFRQSLHTRAQKSYDVLEIRLPEGTVREVFFDITHFFGK